eukprot:scaffold15190_cov61-Phaeocystis_antarctica.AAC.7
MTLVQEPAKADVLEFSGRAAWPNAVPWLKAPYLRKAALAHLRGATRHTDHTVPLCTLAPLTIQAGCSAPSGNRSRCHRNWNWNWK